MRPKCCFNTVHLLYYLALKSKSFIMSLLYDHVLQNRFSGVETPRQFYLENPFGDVSTNGHTQLLETILRKCTLEGQLL